jgi:hypothetical protein
MRGKRLSRKESAEKRQKMSTISSRDILEEIHWMRRVRTIEALENLKWTLCRQIRNQLTCKHLGEHPTVVEIRVVSEALKEVLNSYWKPRIDAGIVLCIEDEIHYEYLTNCNLERWILENWGRMRSWNEIAAGIEEKKEPAIESDVEKDSSNSIMSEETEDGDENDVEMNRGTSSSEDELNEYAGDIYWGEE